MKKIHKLLAIIFAIALMVSVVACSSPEEISKPDHDHEYDLQTVVYREKDKKLYIGNPCLKCEEVKTTQDVVDVDYVVNSYAPNCDFANGSVVVFKSGLFNNCEISQTYENVKFYGEDGAMFYGFKIYGGSNVLIENIQVIGMERLQFKGDMQGVIIINCQFSQYGAIFGSKDYNVNDIKILNCSFTSLHNDVLLTAINIYNYDNLTIKDCVFDMIEFNAIQVGNNSAKGDVLIEGNIFKNVQSRVVYLVKVDSLDSCNIVNNVFYDHTHVFSSTEDNAKRSTGVYVHSLSSTGQITIGVNTWENVPQYTSTWITPRAVYDANSQIQMN